MTELPSIKYPNVPTLNAKNRHIDPDSLEILDPNPYLDPDLMNPDPQHFWAAELCIYLVSVDDIDLPHFLFLQ
jgi:hypothetical protein